MRTGRSVRGVLLIVFAAVLIFGGAIGIVQGKWAEAALPEEESENTIILSSSDKELKLLVPQLSEESEEDGARIQTERDVAEVLSEYLSEITGRTPEIVEGDVDAMESGDQLYIVLRLLPGSEAPRGSYILRAGKNVDQTPSEDKNLYIEGYDLRGLINGVYAYLRTFCGVNIYSTKVRTVPKSDTVTVTDGYLFFYKPLLEYADTDWLSPHDRDFSEANGLNGTYSPGDIAGGKVNYISFCHSLANSIVPGSRDFKDHPEYFALSEKGVRRPTQLCLSNPTVVELAKQDVLEMIENGYNENACMNIVSVTQADNQDYCHCDECNKIADTYGGQSGLMLWFVNQIADAVAASEYADVVVDTFAYQYTRQAPVGIEPRENVCVRLCTIECCFAHALEDENCESNVEFIKDIRNWAAICSRLYIWDYTTNYSQTLGIFPDFDVLQKNIDTFVKYNVVGIYEEGNYYAGGCNTEFADLRSYLLARYMYDPLNIYGTTENIRDGFLQAYYGEGWEEVGKFLDYITAHAGNDGGHLYIGSSMNETLHNVTDEDAAMIDQWWKTAIEKAENAGNTEAAARIERSSICWEYYEACVKKGEYKHGHNPIRWMKANQRLIDLLNKYDVSRYNEGTSVDNVSFIFYLQPNEWTSKEILATYTVSYIVSFIIIALSIALVVILILRNKKELIVLPVACVVATILSAVAIVQFCSWQYPALFFVLGTLICICAGTSAPATVYVLKSKKPSKAEMAVEWAALSVVLSVLFLCLSMFFVKNVYDDGKPKMAFFVSYFICQGIMLIGQISVLCKTARKKSNK